MPIYLDNAATSFPKPEEVYAAVDHYQRNIGAAAGRGSFDGGVVATQIVDQCRKRAADLLHAESPERIIFTSNATDSLNTALHGLLRPGDHVVTSQLEHNSVLRPLREMRDRLDIEVTIVPPDSDGRVNPAEFSRALRPNTRLVTLIHASNVTGAIQPVDEVGQIARAAGARFLVDAAQTAGHIAIDLRSLPADLLACAGYKGLLGPLGTGLLYLRPGLEAEVVSLRQGGTGSQSEEDRQPAILPDKYESGNLNVLGIAGLSAGIHWIQGQGQEKLRAHEQELTQELFTGLVAISGVRVFGQPDVKARVGVVSLTVDGYDPQTVATILDQNYGIQVRSGLHCAPGAHRALQTLESGGTIRLSVGPFSTSEEIRAAIAAVGEIASAAL